MQTLPPTRFSESYKLGWVNFAKFSGRARRSEFWFFALGNLPFIIILPILAKLFTIGLIILFIFCIAVFLPSLSLSVRRLHDTGRSGYYILLGLIIIIGEFILLYFFCQDSEERQNEYGPSPKYILPNSQVAPIYNNFPNSNTYNTPVQPYPPQPYPSQPAYMPPGIPPTQGVY